LPGSIGAYYTGTYDGALAAQKFIIEEDDKKYGKSTNFHIHNITLISVPKEVAIEQADISMIRSLIERGLMEDNCAFLKRKNN